MAITPYETEELNALLIGHGVEVPNSVGLFGGLEGCCNQGYVAAPEDGRSAGRIFAPEDLGSPHVLGAKPESFTLRRGEVFAYSFQGGGGYGDPLARDPALVASDVLDGLLTRSEAGRTYGVVLRGDEADGQATRARRLGIRAARLGRPPEGRPGDPSGWEPRLALGPSVGLDDDGVARCRCGHELAAAGGNWVDGALTRVVDPAEHGPHVRLHEELELREHICPGCATLLESEVARVGATSLHTVEVRL